ncbi:hypothetical protein D7M10_12705 [Pseudomonas fluorescens]|jgi:hypothetical protein|uniref:hypothetical protein n=1 Tax=Pseudomonas TaxID=286 RepID=UPI0009BF11CF|nr:MULTISPECIES: hypothetical protein [Pseudomonas]AYG07895.1 hypothetical protein D7M10_12705 [Pseudomonas fluorescens]MDZ4300298.1 hypothetical protein [Pseudomonas sp.]MBJ2239657.1 hypothetical protein [Pseudomonas sp. MF6768]MBJ2253779.1 hypothetical protein [Pseudomonas sp. MF6784]MBJ2260133.1 hypothetical protein [Pseudomonas sp. MF6787]
MNFQTLVLPDVRTLASALRATPCRVSRGIAPARTALACPSPRISPVHLRAHWRLCPTTGHLVQQWDHADPQDPQRRNVSSLPVHVRLLLSAHAA